MILLGYILWLALAVYVGKRVMRQVNRSRGAKLATGWSVGILMALLPLWDIILGLPITIDACTNRAGLQVNENVSLPLSSVVVVNEYVPMSGCSECTEILGRGLAKEALATLEVGPSGRVHIAAMVSEPGPTRYWVSSKGDPYCDAYFRVFSPDERQQHEFWTEEDAAPSEDACIAAQSIPAISTDYRLSFADRTQQHGPVTLHIREALLSRQRNGKRLASLALLYQAPWIGLFSGVPDFGMPACPLQRENADGTYSHDIRPATLLRRLAAQQKAEGFKP